MLSWFSAYNFFFFWRIPILFNFLVTFEIQLMGKITVSIWFVSRNKLSFGRNISIWLTAQELCHYVAVCIWKGEKNLALWCRTKWWELGQIPDILISLLEYIDQKPITWINSGSLQSKAPIMRIILGRFAFFVMAKDKRFSLQVSFTLSSLVIATLKGICSH